jgi:hypothetical protein
VVAGEELTDERDVKELIIKAIAQVRCSISSHAMQQIDRINR